MLYPLSYRGLRVRAGCYCMRAAAMIPAPMGMQAIALVFAGAGAGGVVRYLLPWSLNPLLAALPLGRWPPMCWAADAAGATARPVLGDAPGPGPYTPPLLILPVSWAA